MNKILKICGDSFNSNLDIDHTKELIGLLVTEFYNQDERSITIMELIASFAFAILEDFDCILDEDATLENNIQKTKSNIDKLYNYLYGGYHD